MKKSALLLVLALPVFAHATEREWVSYQQLIDKMRLDKFYAIPPAERDHLDLHISVRPDNKSLKPGDINLILVHGGERQALPLSADYRLPLAYNPKWLAEDARIMTNLAPGEKSGMNWVLLTPLPEGTQWNYTSIMSGVQQSNHAIKQMAGAFSLFAPTIKVVIFKFAKPAQLKILARDGVKLYSSDAQGQIKLKPEDALLKENPLMVASERPTEAELDTE